MIGENEKKTTTAAALAPTFDGGFYIHNPLQPTGCMCGFHSTKQIHILQKYDIYIRISKAILNSPKNFDGLIWSWSVVHTTFHFVCEMFNCWHSWNYEIFGLAIESPSQEKGSTFHIQYNTMLSFCFRLFKEKLTDCWIETIWFILHISKKDSLLPLADTLMDS